jgi:hypothetical protein
MPCLTELHPLFYPSGVKIIPKNIYDLLTPVALAHLVMGDGSKERHGLIICTDSPGGGRCSQINKCTYNKVQNRMYNKSS